nr:hypothetical protein CFP56_06857 [Quercus suber]
MTFTWRDNGLEERSRKIERFLSLFIPRSNTSLNYQSCSTRSTLFHYHSCQKWECMTLKYTVQTLSLRKGPKLMMMKLIQFKNFHFKARFCFFVLGLDCLMIQLPVSMGVTDTLRQFLSDETICFLGTEMSEKVAELENLYFYDYAHRVDCKTGVEVGYLAAKILKKGNIDKYGLSKLAGEVGMDIKEPIGACPNWNAVAFSDEEVKYAVHNAYTSYVIGKRLLDML